MMVCTMSVMHIAWGVLLLVNMGGLHITATSAMYYFLGGAAYETRAFMYMAVGFLPLMLLSGPRWPKLNAMACIPQLAMLMLSGISAVVAISLGHYPDGTVPLNPHYFMGMDQGIYILLPITYAWEIIDRYQDQIAAARDRAPLVVAQIDEGSTRVL